MFTTLPGAVGGAVSDSVVLAVIAGALPHMLLFGLWWCWMLDMCLSVTCVCVSVCPCVLSVYVVCVAVWLYPVGDTCTYVLYNIYTSQSLLIHTPLVEVDVMLSLMCITVCFE